MTDTFIVLEYSLDDGFMHSGTKVYGPDTYWMCESYINKKGKSEQGNGYITVSSREKYDLKPQGENDRMRNGRI
jgi:hypothetical protein